MSLNFNNCVVKINGTGLWCQSASLNSSNGGNIAQSVGHVGGVGSYVDNGVTSEVSISYYLKPTFEPNLGLINRLVNSTGIPTFEPYSISVGGITGSYYLKSFDLSINPNNVVSVGASYSSYSSLSGILQSDSLSESYTWDNFAHAFTAVANPQVGTAYELSCNFNINLQPLYTVGNREPEVFYSFIEQNVSVTRDYYTGIAFYPEKFDDVFGLQEIRFDALSSLAATQSSLDALTLNVSQSDITSTSFNASTNDIIRVRMDAKKIL